MPALASVGGCARYRRPVAQFAVEYPFIAKCTVREVSGHARGCLPGTIYAPQMGACRSFPVTANLDNTDIRRSS
jgi:hypothetical protein